MCDISRRGFVAGCSAAIAGLAGSRFNTIALAQSGSSQEILLVLFLRGGIDGLNFLPPIAGADRGYYEAARPTLRVPASGAGAAIPINSQFGMNPLAGPLLDLYQAGKLSLVLATGQPEANRSHFESMDAIELGTPGISSGSTGWLARHLQSAPGLPPDPILPSLSMGGLQQASLRGDLQTASVNSPGSFALDTGPFAWRDVQRAALRSIYSSGTSMLHATGIQALNAVDVIGLYVSDTYTPANGAVYPAGSFGEHLQTIAQLIKTEVGLSVATLDLGGWDTHASQSAFFPALLTELSQGLHALYTDLDGAGAANYTSRLTVVVQSEFGRRLAENSDDGTDHGYGNLMMVLSGNASGGIHGVWPGLAPGQLFEGIDVAVTTDYRRVLSEILIRRLGNNKLGVVFPGYTDYSPLGVISGTDLTPDYKGGPGSTIFADGFESGDTSKWGT